MAAPAREMVTEIDTDNAAQASVSHGVPEGTIELARIGGRTITTPVVSSANGRYRLRCTAGGPVRLGSGATRRAAGSAAVCCRRERTPRRGCNGPDEACMVK